MSNDYNLTTLGMCLGLVTRMWQNSLSTTGDKNALNSISGVNFINVFTGSFYACRSQKRKKLLNLTVFFALLGSALVKAARKMLVKLTPVCYRVYQGVRPNLIKRSEMIILGHFWPLLKYFVMPLKAAGAA